MRKLFPFEGADKADKVHQPEANAPEGSHAGDRQKGSRNRVSPQRWIFKKSKYRPR